jgi:hypothetical protein
MHFFVRFWGWVWGCSHARLGWVFSDDDGLYRCCLRCGRRLPYSRVKFPVLIREKGKVA